MQQKVFSLHCKSILANTSNAVHHSSRMKFNTRIQGSHYVYLVSVLVGAFWLGVMVSWVWGSVPQESQPGILTPDVVTAPVMPTKPTGAAVREGVVILPKIEEEISQNYPPTRRMEDILSEWNPDYPEDQPLPFVEALQVFNYSDPRERMLAEKYREAEVPFKIYDIPDLDAVIALWSEDYLTKQLTALSKQHVEHSTNNHFMYWTNRKGRTGGANYKTPTNVVQMTFPNWLRLAQHADATRLQAEADHYYFMAGSAPGQQSSHFVSNDLRFFSTRHPNFFITNVQANKGIQCRFGMRGIIAEAHYDTGKNFVAMLKGSKRYILAAPSECENMNIIKDTTHPSFRHSVVDWSDIDDVRESGLGNAQGIDTVVRAGEMLYIPSFWFHHITSLGYSVQCNSRSGMPRRGQGKADIDACLGKKLNLSRYQLLRGQH